MTLEDLDNNELIMYLDNINDPRKPRGIRYKFSHLLLMCIYAILSGHTKSTDIEYYVELRIDYFKALLGIDSVPSHDTFSRVLRIVNFNELSNNLDTWIKSRFPDICKRYQGKKVLHIDGKAIIAASERSKGCKPIYELNAMYEGESIGIILDRIGNKENEISCIPRYLNNFNLDNTIVTCDAIACQKNIIEAITKANGNYIFPVKENQKKLYRSIVDKVNTLIQKNEFNKLDACEYINKDHGRIEKISMHLIKDTSFIYEQLGNDSFKGSIARIGVMKKTTTYINEDKTIDTITYLITDLQDIDVDTLLKIKKSHWNIEMQHYLLDMQLLEDRCTARKDNALVNSSLLRRFCLMVRIHDDEEMKSKPFNRFLMANDHDETRIERLLFDKVLNNSND